MAGNVTSSDIALFTFGPDAAGSAIRGLAITGAEVPIALFSSGVSVDGNFFGLDAKGKVSASLPNVLAAVYVHGGRNRIGGDTPDLRNVFAGNQGVSIAVGAGNGNVIAGNYLGTDPGGTEYWPNAGIAGMASPLGGPLRADILFANIGLLACFPASVYSSDTPGGSTKTLVGGYGRLSGNVIASAGDACSVVELRGGANTIAGNYFGTNWKGWAGIRWPSGQVFEQLCGVLTTVSDTLVEFNTIANSGKAIVTGKLPVVNMRNDSHGMRSVITTS